MDLFREKAIDELRQLSVLVFLSAYLEFLLEFTIEFLLCIFIIRGA